MTEEISTLTVYDGSKQCKVCGQVMSPLEVMYSEDGRCPYCRNQNYERHAKRGMADG